MAERESDQAERDRKDAEIAAENLERQYRQGVIERPKTKAKSKAKDEKEESEA
jgi:hypothetical protein